MGFPYEEKRKHDGKNRPSGGPHQSLRRFVYLMILLAIIGFASDIHWYYTRINDPYSLDYLQRHGVEVVATITGKVGRAGCCCAYIQYTYEGVNTSGRRVIFASAEYVNDITFRAMQIGDRATIVYAPGSNGYTRLAHIVREAQPARLMPVFVFVLPLLAVYAIPLWLIRRLVKFLNR